MRRLLALVASALLLASLMTFAVMTFVFASLTPAVAPILGGLPPPTADIAIIIASSQVMQALGVIGLLAISLAMIAPIIHDQKSQLRMKFAKSAFARYVTFLVGLIALETRLRQRALATVDLISEIPRHALAALRHRGLDLRSPQTRFRVAVSLN